jgi:transposase
MEGTSVVYAGIDTHKDKHVLCVLDAMGRSGLQRGVSGRQGLIRIARRGNSGMQNRAVSPSWRPCGPSATRGAGARAKTMRTTPRPAKVHRCQSRGAGRPRQQGPSCVRTSTAAASAVKSLLGAAPEEIHSKFARVGTSEMMRSLARKRPKGAELVADSLLVLQALAKTWVDELEALVVELVQDNAPALLKI